MEWIVAVLVVVVLGVAAAAATGRLGGMKPTPVRDTFRQDLPAGPLSADDLRQLRLGIGVRGYAFEQVDDLIDRLAEEIDAKDRRIAELEARLEVPGVWSPFAPTVDGAPDVTSPEVFGSAADDSETPVSEVETTLETAAVPAQSPASPDEPSEAAR